jgi:hypothetical protein
VTAPSDTRGLVLQSDGSYALTPWDNFVCRHRLPWNVVGHLISFLMFYGGPTLALVRWDARWLILFFTSGVVGAASHWLTGDGAVDTREATSSPQTVLFVNRMFLRIAIGQYSSDIATALARRDELARRNGAATPAPRGGSGGSPT